MIARLHPEADLSASIARISSCRCDFCTGKKLWADNWCPRCGEFQMQPPKSIEGGDVCDKCEQEQAAQDAEESP